MRTAYHEQLDALNTILGDMCELAGAAMSRATQALLQADLSVAESVITDNDRMSEMSARAEELQLELTEQMGRPIRYGQAEFSTFGDRGMWLINQAEKALRDEEVGPERPEGFRRIIRRAPLGVCLLVGAWNVSRFVTSPQSLMSQLTSGLDSAVPLYAGIRPD